MPLSELRQRTRERQQLNENYAYTLNPLRTYPIIRLSVRQRDSLVAPIPTFLFWRFTEGVYYEVVNEADFGTGFGEAFQDYVGEVAKRSAEGKPLSILPEREYWVGRERKDTVEWILEDESASVFVECKTKRLKLTAKIEILSSDALNSDLEKLADFIVQVYKSVRDYLNGYYPHCSHRREKPVYPLVVTLEEWHAFGPIIQGALDNLVAEKLQREGLPVDWLREIPFAHCSSPDFEELVQVISNRGVDTVMRAKATNPEYRKWEMYSYLNREFHEDVKNVRKLFSEVLDEISFEGSPGHVATVASF